MSVKTYRIITNHGKVDFASTVEEGSIKFQMYANDMYDGFSEWVELVEVDVDTGRERKIMGAAR